MDDVTPPQRRILQTWFEDVYDRYERFEFPIHFIRVIVGDKPATYLQQFEWDNDDSPFNSEEELLAFVEDLGLLHHQQENNRNHTICRSSRQLNLLASIPQLRSKTAQQWRLGIVYGYPREDVEWFIRDEDRTTPRDRVNNGDFSPEEMAYVDFVAYVNEDSIEGYERAIENGKRVRALLSDVTDDWQLPIIDQIATDHYQLSLSVYSGEREHFPGEITGFKMIAKNPALDD